MYHPRYNNLVFFGSIFSFLFGVGIRSFVEIPLFIYCIPIVLSLVWVIVWRRTPMIPLFSLLFCVWFSFGGLRFEVKEIHQYKTIFDDQVGQEITLQGFVDSEPIRSSSKQRFILETNDKPKQKILVGVDQYPKVYFGDAIEVSGKLQKPQNFITENGREFDYVHHLAKDEIYYTMSFGKVGLRDEDPKRNIRSLLFALKDSFISASQRVIPEPESALLGGIVLGVKQSLGEELEEQFIRTGTIHIVVLSGYNVTIVSESIVRGLQTIFSQNIALSLGGFGIVLFALITGATTTTIRASVMGLLGLLARVTGRNYDIVRGLCLAGFLMVLFNPYTLMFDISFQLSFIATLGLILISPIVSRWRISKIFPTKFGVREIFASTIGTQIAVLPFLVHSIGTLSIISPLANMLILPVIPLSMGVGAFAGLFEMITHLGSNPFSWASYGLLHYTVSMVEWLASFSWSAVVVPSLNGLFVLGLYALIVWWIWKQRAIVFLRG